MSLTKSHEDASPSKEEIYQALLRSLRRRKGFGIVFVQCSPAEAKQLIQQVQQDLPQKQVATLTLTQPIDKLYDLIANLPERNELNILFIQGLEKSLEAYIEPGYGGEGNYYNIDTVPNILIHLNQRREIFRDQFNNICFVFVLPSFAIKYFIRRAPDFFDWGAGVFEFPTRPEILKREFEQIFQEQDYKKYRNLSQKERDRKILEIQSRLEEQYQPSEKAQLLTLEGDIFLMSQKYEDSINCYNQALNLTPDKWQAWISQGLALYNLRRYEEAISSFDRVLELQPDNGSAWILRGNALSELGRYEEAIANYDRALERFSYRTRTYYWSLYNRGVILAKLGRYGEAIKSYWQAIIFSPGYYFNLFLKDPKMCIKTLIADIKEAIIDRVTYTIISTILKKVGIKFR